MSKAEAYYELVRYNLLYYHGQDFNDLLVDVIAEMRKKNCPPELCASIIHRALLNAAIPACERKE